MQLLVSITGLWPIVGIIVSSAAIGFGLGLAVYNNNVKKAQQLQMEAEQELARFKSAGTAIGNAVKKV